MKSDFERYRRALEKIRDYDASKAEGCLDEWQEAAAFNAVQDIARDALEPGYLQEKHEAAERERREMLEKRRLLYRGIGANRRWFYRNGGTPENPFGYWVRVLPKPVDAPYTESCVSVKVLTVVGVSAFPYAHVKGSEFSVNVANLVSESRALDFGVVPIDHDGAREGE